MGRSTQYTKLEVQRIEYHTIQYCNYHYIPLNRQYLGRPRYCFRIKIYFYYKP